MKGRENIHGTYLEFLTVALHFTTIVEKSDTAESSVFVKDLSRILPYLYLKALLIEIPETEIPEEIPTSVTQEEYDSVCNTISKCLGNNDVIVFIPEGEDEEGHFVQISELIADIYQDIKSFAVNYRLSPDDEKEMIAAWLKQTFFEYWGKKLINVQSGLHKILAEKAGISESSGKEKNDSDNWIISKRQKDWGYQDEV